MPKDVLFRNWGPLKALEDPLFGYLGGSFELMLCSLKREKPAASRFEPVLPPEKAQRVQHTAVHIYIYVYVYLCMYLQTYSHMHTDISMCIYHVYVYTCLHAR